MLSPCTVKLLLPCSLLIITLRASTRNCLLASCPPRACLSAFRRNRIRVMLPPSACMRAVAIEGCLPSTVPITGIACTTDLWSTLSRSVLTRKETPYDSNVTVSTPLSVT